MKIQLEPYNPDWIYTFGRIKSELKELIGFLSPEIEHIGSTSVAELSAKPIIDILVGLEDESLLDKTVQPLIDKGYIYYEKYNDDMPYRRFFVKLKDVQDKPVLPSVITENDEIPEYLANHQNRLAHIHILPCNSEHWIRHIAFRDYLRTHPDIKQEYQKLKEALSLREWTDGNDYNEGKDSFLKTEEQKAVAWYQNKKTVRFELVLQSMKDIFKTVPYGIDHTEKVLDNARQILATGSLSSFQTEVVELSAILHDIGALEAQRKHGSMEGKYQEMEGPAIASEILHKHEYDEAVIRRVCFIVGHHHTPEAIDDMDFRILWDADLIENMQVMDVVKDQEALSLFIRKHFKTDTGKEIARKRYE